MPVPEHPRITRARLDRVIEVKPGLLNKAHSFLTSEMPPGSEPVPKEALVFHEPGLFGQVAKLKVSADVPGGFHIHVLDVETPIKAGAKSQFIAHRPSLEELKKRLAKKG